MRGSFAILRALRAMLVQGGLPGILILGSWLVLTMLVAAPSAGAAWKLERSTTATGLTAMDVDPSGEQVVVYNEGFETQGLRRYARDGSALNAWATPPFPTNPDVTRDVYEVRYAGENVLALTGETSTLIRYNRAGQALEELAVTDPTPPPDVEIPFPISLDVDTKREIYVGYNDVADDDLSGVQRLGPSGQRIAFWEAPEGPEAGRFESIPSIASNGAGVVFTAERAGNRVQSFTDTGAFIRQWGQFGVEPGRFDAPSAIAVDRAGDVWVGDGGFAFRGLRLQHFRPDGTFVEQIELPDGVGITATAVAGIGFDSAGRLYAAIGGSQRDGGIYVYSPSGGRGAGISLRSKSLRYRAGEIKVRLSCGRAAACRGKVGLKKRKLNLGSRGYRIRAGRSATVAVKVKPKGKRALARSGKHKVKVELQPKGGKKLVKTVAMKVRGGR